MSLSLKGRHWIVIFSLLALIGLGVAGLVLTRDDNTTADKPNTTKRRGPVVDQSAAADCAAVGGYGIGP